MSNIIPRAEEVRRLCKIIISADATLKEIDTQIALQGYEEMSVTQETVSNEAQSKRDNARKALPGALGLTEDDLKLLHGVI